MVYVRRAVVQSVVSILLFAYIHTGVSSDESVAIQIECDSSPDMFADSSNTNSPTEGLYLICVIITS